VAFSNFFSTSPSVWRPYQAATFYIWIVIPAYKRNLIRRAIPRCQVTVFSHPMERYLIYEKEAPMRIAMKSVLSIVAARVASCLLKKQQRYCEITVLNYLQ
jgi:hypothetical protein